MADHSNPPASSPLSILLRGLALFLIIAVAAWLAVYYHDFIGEFFRHPHKLRERVASYGNFGPLVFIGLQVLQIVVFVIPGEVVQAVGGSVFGTWVGLFYCLVGAALGSSIAFLLAKWLGRPFVRAIIKPKDFAKLDNILNHKQGIITTFLLFLIPGIPKDALCYIAGLTPMHFLVFVIVSCIARLPGMFLSTYFGAEFSNRSYANLIILASIAVLAMILGLIFHKRIERWLTRKKPRNGENGGTLDEEKQA